jgi:release factor glutamine methyltransferase
VVDAPLRRDDLIEAAGRRLREAGASEPRREARRIWTDLRPASHDPVVSTTVAPDVAARYDAAVERRAAGEPLAYVTGWTGFRHLTLASDGRALIPRPETEGLVEAALARARCGVAADVGTGTGAIALSLAHEGSFIRVIGTDLSADALALARSNGEATGLAVDWRLGDLLAPLAGERLDLLVSNPPYLTADEYAGLDASVRDYEPALALASGVDGLDATRRLLDGAPALMANDGWLAMEIDSRRGAASAACAAAAGWSDVIVQDDLFGRARYLLARHRRPE